MSEAIARSSVELDALILELQQGDSSFSLDPQDEEADLASCLRSSELGQQIQQTFEFLQQELERHLSVENDVSNRIQLLLILRDMYDKKIAYQHACGIEPDIQLVIARSLSNVQLETADVILLGLINDDTTVKAEEKEDPCVVCDGEDHLLKPDCGHSYCRSCFRQVVKVAEDDETMWPPRCCRISFDEEMITLCLDEEEV